MADVWSRIGVKPYEADPSKVKLSLDDAPKAAPKPKPQSEYDQFIASDGVLPSIVRGLATTGNRTLSYLNAGADALGLDPVVSPNRIDGNLNYLEQIKERNSQEGIIPTRKREIDAIKAEVAKAQGWDAAGPIVKQFADTLIHPSEWTLQGAVENFSPSDPVNLAGIGMGSIIAKPAKTMIGKAIARAAGGAAEGGAIGSAAEYASAIGRGKSEAEAEKASIAGSVGGVLTGSVMGSVAGAATKKPNYGPTQDDVNAYVNETMNGWAGTSQQPKSAAPKAPNDQITSSKSLPYNPLTDANGVEDPALLGYDAQKQIPYSNEVKQIPYNGAIISGLEGWSSPLGNRIQEAIDAQSGNILYDKINGIIDTEVQARTSELIIGWAGKREEDVKAESAQVQAQIQELLANGMDPKGVSGAIDNLITPSREDIAITNILNDNKPLPSRLSGVRLIPTLENSINAALQNPAIARTNQEFYEVMLSNGASKDLASVMTSAYAAKDPQILRDHISQTISKNAPALIDPTPIRSAIEEETGSMIQAYETVRTAENNSKTLANNSEIIVDAPNKVDEVFNELEFKPSKPNDSSVFFVYKGHEYFVNPHGVMGKVSFLDDGRKWYSYGDIQNDSGLSYTDLQKINDRIYKMKGRDVDNTPITTQADRDANSEKLFVEYLTRGESFKGEDLDLPRAFKDFWKPTKPQSIEEFKKYVSKNKDKYKNDSKTLANNSETIAKAPKKRTSVQAEKIKAASEIPVGGSETDAKAAVKSVFQKQQDSEYKKMSAKDRADLEAYYANAPEDLYGKATAATNEVYGNDVGSANMALIDARAKAMGITSDEFMQRYGVEIDNKTDQDGAQYVKDMEEADALFQKAPQGSRLAEWHKDSHPLTKNEDGAPKVFYHGSLKNFDRFDHTKGEGSMFGRGVYITSSAEDASSYASKDPSKNIDIPGKAEKLQSELGISYKEARDVVTKGHEQVYPIYVNVKNPIIIGDGTPIQADIKSVETAIRFAGENDPEWAARKARKFKTLANWGKDHEADMLAVYKDREIKSAMERYNDPSLAQLEIIGNKAMKELMINKNADGIVINNINKLYRWMEEGSSHIYVRIPEQIKSIHNQGMFNDKDPNILKQTSKDVKLSEEVINGMVDLGFKSTGEMRSSIKIFATADVSTLPHELFHVFERTLTKEEKEAFDYAFRDYKAGEDRSEAGARGWETYLSEGKAPTKELEGVFEKFKTWLRDLWEMVFQSPENGFKINDQQRAFYRAIMGDKEAIKEVFSDAAPSDVKPDPVAAKILDEMPEHTTVTKGENTQGGLFGADDGIIEQPKLFSDKVEVDTLKVPDGIKATPQEYRTTVREMAKGESLTYPMIADQIKRSKSYIEAQEEQIIRSGGESLFDEPTLQAPTTLDDVGAKIGGARKDAWKDRGLTTDDLDAMSGGEQAKYATKENVLGKPDYAKMVNEGKDPYRMAIYKIVRDRLAAKPSKDDPTYRRNYVEGLSILKEVFNDFIDGKIEEKFIEETMIDRLGYIRQGMKKYADMDADQKRARDLFWSFFKGKYSPLGVNASDMRKAREMVKQGFPNVEPFRKVYDVLAIRPLQDGSMIYGLHDMVNGYRRALRGADDKVLEFGSKDEAFAYAKKLYEERKSAPKPAEKEEPKRPHLDTIVRNGDDVRGGKDVGSDDFMKQYGFRGVEFGNWAAKDERQKIINHAYDAMNDLAQVLNIPNKAVSLNGTLGMAFGARGGGRFAAHYETSKIVINMTKLRGAGTLAHEWGHAMDHYFGELDRSNAYDGKGRYTSGGRERRIDRTNQRVEVREAFANVMDALFHKDANRAEVIRKYELEIENAIASGSNQVKAMQHRLEWLKSRDGSPAAKDSEYMKEAKNLNGGKSDGYWTRPTEMFARAFEAYVFDKLNASGKRSDYLVQGVEGERYADGFKGNPYPVGIERETINAAFDALFNAIKNEALEDGNVRLYQTRRAADGISKIMEEC